MTGYDITCDPGDLYSRKCYVNVHTPSGCVAGAPGCVVTQQEIIGYQGSNPISKAPTTAAGTAWQPSLTVLNQDGTAYQPFGGGGMPWTMGGLAGMGKIMPSSGADPQDWKYITESAPGSQARIAYQNRTCNPLWPTFGCKTGNTNPTGVTTAPDDQTSAGTIAWLQQYFGFWNAEENYASQSTDNKIIKWWTSLIGS